MNYIRQTKEYADYMSGLGWIVEEKKKVKFFIKKIPLVGSVLKIQKPREVDIDAINLLSKKYKVFQIILEPLNMKSSRLILKNNFRQSKTYYSPSRTIQLDLTKPLSLLLKKMHHKTRYNIRRVKSNKFKTLSSDDIELYASFWQDCARSQRGMFLSQKREIVEIYNSFRQKAKIILVTKGKDILSGILMVCSKDAAHYMYAGATEEGKKLFAPTINAWAAIKMAKKLGCGIFDFEGVYDERFPVKSWLGFSRFKKSFGGAEILYPGCYTKFRFPTR